MTILWEGLLSWRALARYWELIRERCLERKHFSFIMQVIDRSHLNAAGGYAEGKVLDSLEFLNKGWRGIRLPNIVILFVNLQVIKNILLMNNVYSKAIY